MAKRLETLLKKPIELPFEYINPDFKCCPNGCGPLLTDKHAYIESNVTGERYCDIVCMVKAEGARFEGEYIVDEKKWYTKEQWKLDREVVEHG